MVPWVGLQYVIVVFPDHTRLLFGALFLEESSAYFSVIFFCFFSVTKQSLGNVFGVPI